MGAADSGIDMSRVGHPDTHRMFQCPVCVDVFTGHIIECPECEEIFCFDCVSKAYKQSNTCPLCRKTTKDPSTWRRNIAIERRVGNLHCECENRELGCTVEVTRFTKTNHEMSCEFGQVMCTYGCQKTIVRKNLKHHQESECPNRPIKCPQGCSTSVMFKDVDAHISNVCDNTLTTCPNNCGEELRRGGVVAHRKACELETLSCMLVNEGCDAKIKRKDLEKHLAEPQHFVFCVRGLASLRQALDESRVTNQNLRADLNNANHAIAKLNNLVRQLCQKSHINSSDLPPEQPVVVLPTVPEGEHSTTEVSPPIPTHSIVVGDCVRLSDVGHLYPTVGRIPDHSGLESWPSEDIKKLSINANWKRRHIVGDVGVVVHLTTHAIARNEVAIVKIENDYVCVDLQGLVPIGN
eukprot:c2700_g1_i1.p1 GENE.c2700_g1_i1~~c2700_g1_i1.p1  ORF type:complete len:408 (-),score=78.60 c2700_g1_i1:71-1294(-)